MNDGTTPFEFFRPRATSNAHMREAPEETAAAVLSCFSAMNRHHRERVIEQWGKPPDHTVPVDAMLMPPADPGLTAQVSAFRVRYNDVEDRFDSAAYRLLEDGVEYVRLPEELR